MKGKTFSLLRTDLLKVVLKKRGFEKEEIEDIFDEYWKEREKVWKSEMK